MKNVIFIVLLCSFGFGQVNTEAMRNNTKDSGFTNTLGFDLGFEKSKEEVLDLAGNYRVDFIGKNGLNSFFILNYENGYEKEDDSKNSIVNKGFSHFRLYYLINKMEIL